MMKSAYKGKFLVSIVVPIYNVEQHLSQCIDSLCKQTYEKLEIILVNDGSTDHSEVICNQYAEQDSRIHVIHKLNGGPSEARRSGIASAKGEYLTIVDGDDWLDEDTIEGCVHEIEKNPGLDCVFFSYVKEYPNKSIPMHVLDNTIILSPLESEQRVYRRLFGLSDSELAHPERMDNIVSCCMKLYRTEVARKGEYFDTKIVGSSEDALFNMYALFQCGQTVYLDRCFYHYRKVATSLTNSFRPQLEQKWTVLFSEMERVIDQKNLPAEYDRALKNRIAMSVVGIGMNELVNQEHGLFERWRYIREYIRGPQYVDACRGMKIANLPFVWKVFMLCSKWKLALPVYLMLYAMKILKSKL